MTTKLSELMAELSADDRKEVEKRSRAHLKAMADARRLDEIRHAAKKTQGDIARAMGIGQNAVSQLEKRKDLQLSTLNRYVESVGFRLEVAIVSDSGERVTLGNFRPWEEEATTRAKTAKKRSEPKRTATSASSRPRRSIETASQRATAARGMSKNKKSRD